MESFSCLLTLFCAGSPTTSSAQGFRKSADVDRVGCPIHPRFSDVWEDVEVERLQLRRSFAHSSTVNFSKLYFAVS
jgi:hypothetical protein